MALQPLPSSAEAYGVAQRAEVAAAVSAGLRQWRRMGEDFDPSYAVIEPTLLTIADEAQARLAVGAQEYIPAVLAETGQRRAVAPRFAVDEFSLVGTAGDGLPTEGLLYGAVIHAKAAVGAGQSVGRALDMGGRWLTTAMSTLLSDTARASERLAMQARPVTGWVRMLTPPSCGRCVILAGRRERSSTPFPRHPHCDCRAIPASESVAGDLTVDSVSYLQSLDEADLAHALGSRANARAFSEFGADPVQIVNAYRRKLVAPGKYAGGIRSAQVYGRNVRYTTEGTTRRGIAYARMRQMRGAQTSQDESGYAIRITRDGPEARSIRTTRLRAPRLMPESIAQIATDRADQERLLRLYGWLG